MPPTVFFSRLLCVLGFHNFRVVGTEFAFSAGARTEKIECRRCGIMFVREI